MRKHGFAKDLKAESSGTVKKEMEKGFNLVEVDTEDDQPFILLWTAQATQVALDALGLPLTFNQLLLGSNAMDSGF